METTLGLSLGTRFVGFAVQHNGELIDWRIKTFRDKWSKKKQKKIIATITEILDAYSVQTIVNRELHPTYCTKELYQLTNTIKSIATKKGISFVTYSLEQLELTKNSSQKKGVMTHTLQKHPHLSRFCEQERKSRREYYIKMFEAIALLDGYTRG